MFSRIGLASSGCLLSCRCSFYRQHTAYRRCCDSIATGKVFYKRAFAAGARMHDPHWPGAAHGRLVLGTKPGNRTFPEAAGWQWQHWGKTGRYSKAKKFDTHRETLRKLAILRYPVRINFCVWRWVLVWIPFSYHFIFILRQLAYALRLWWAFLF